MREYTCCFTGHRFIPQDQLEAIAVRTETAIRALISKRGIRYFGVGGAIGYDTLVAQILFRLREEFPQIKVILVYPFPDFTSRWSAAQKETYASLLPQYDKCVCVAPEANKEAYLDRDRHLVDNSSICIAYCTQDSGGTAYTVRYVLRRGVPVVNIADPR